MRSERLSELVEKPVRGAEVKTGDRVRGLLVVQVEQNGEQVTLHHPRGGHTTVAAAALIRVQRRVRVEQLPDDAPADDSHVWFVERGERSA